MMKGILLAIAILMPSAESLWAQALPQIQLNTTRSEVRSECQKATWNYVVLSTLEVACFGTIRPGISHDITVKFDRRGTASTVVYTWATITKLEFLERWVRNTREILTRRYGHSRPHTTDTGDPYSIWTTPNGALIMLGCQKSEAVTGCSEGWIR